MSEKDLEQQHTTHEEHPDTRGTLALLLGYMALIVALWGYAYILLLQRGG